MTTKKITQQEFENRMNAAHKAVRTLAQMKDAPTVEDIGMFDEEAWGILGAACRTSSGTFSQTTRNIIMLLWAQRPVSLEVRAGELASGMGTFETVA